MTTPVDHFRRFATTLPAATRPAAGTGREAVRDQAVRRRQELHATLDARDRGYRDAAAMRADQVDQAASGFRPYQGLDQTAGYFSGMDAFRADKDNVSTVPEIAGDVTNKLVTGAANLGLGLTAALVDLNDTHGRAQRIMGNPTISPSEPLRKARNWVNETSQNLLSETARNQDRAYGAMQAEDQAVHQVQYEDDVANSRFAAGLRREGRNAISTVDNNFKNPGHMDRAVVEAAGTMVPMVKGAKFADDVLQGLAPIAERWAGQAAGRAVSAAGKSSFPVVAGLSESGGAMLDAANAVMAIPIEDLRQEPVFQELVNEKNLTEEQAQQVLASEAGRTAKLPAFVTGLVLGRLTQNFEMAPFKASSTMAGVGHIAGQTLEEGTQEAVNRWGSNLGVRWSGANPDQDLAQGVGEATAQGAIAGTGLAAGLQGPSMAINAAVDGTTLAVNGAVAAIKPVVVPVVRKLLERGTALRDRLNAEQEKKVEAAVEQATSTQDLTLESIMATEGAEALVPEEVQSFLDQMTLPPEELNALPEAVRNNLGETATISEALIQASRALDQGLITDEVERQSAFDSVSGMMESAIPALAQQAAELEAKLPEGPLKTRFAEMAAGLSAIPQMGVFNKLVDAEVTAAAERVNSANDAAPTSDRDTLLLANRSPDKISQASARKTLAKIDAGELTVSRQQLANLRAADVLVSSMRNGNAAKMGLEPSADVTSRIQSSMEAKNPAQGPSAVMYARAIARQVLVDGDVEAAKATLERMRNFVEHMNNKTDGVNRSLENWKQDPKDTGVTYKGWDFQKQKPIESQVFVQMGGKSPNSIATAQQIGVDAGVVTGVYNQLVEAFPELGAQTITPVDLAPELTADTAANIHARVKKDGVDSLTQKAEKEKAKPEPKTEPVAREREAAIPDEGADGQPAAEAKPKVPDAGKTEKGIADESAQPTEEKRETAPKAADTKPEPAAEPVSRIAPAQARQLTSAGLQTRIDQIRDRLVTGEEFSDDAATLKVLEAERSAREDALYEEGKAQVEETADPVAEPEAVQTEDQADSVQAAIDVAMAAGEIIEGSPFTDLVGDEDNRFEKNFTVKDGRSRMTRMSQPLAFARKAMSEGRFYNAFAGAQRLWSDQIGGAFDVLFNVMEQNIGLMNANLNAGLDAKGGRLRAMLENGDNVWRFYDKRALASMASLKDGQQAYNQRLAEVSQLAASQVLLREAMVQRKRSVTELASDLSIPVAVARANEKTLNAGSLAAFAVHDIAGLIGEMLGLDPKDDAWVGETQGILASLALEALGSWMQMPNSPIKRHTVQVGPKKQMTVLEVDPTLLPSIPSDAEMATRSLLMAAPDAIMSLAFNDHEAVAPTFGRPSAPDQTQKRASRTTLTDAQVEALEKANQIRHGLVKPRLDLVRKLGAKGLKAFLSRPEQDLDRMHVRTRASYESRNRQIDGALSALDAVIMGAEAFADGGDIHGVDIFYANEINGSGRMQKKGPVHIQNNKILREVILPRAGSKTVDLTQSDQLEAFLRGVAQGLGVKIHQLHLSEIRSKLRGILAKPGVKAMLETFRGDWASVSEAEFEALAVAMRNDLGKDATMAAMAAVMEYAAYQTTKDLKAFETAIYVEADGASNGSGTAMMLNSFGQVTAAMVGHLERVGLSFRRPKADYASLYGDADGINKTDFYKAGSNNFTETAGRFLSREDLDPAVKEQLKKVLYVMERLMPGDVALNWNDEGEIDSLTFDRGAMKNPVTIFLYGSGVKGIAGNFAEAIADAYYARVTQALEPGAEGSTFEQRFMGDPALSRDEARVEFNMLKILLTDLGAQRINTTMEQEVVSYELGADRLNDGQVFWDGRGADQQNLPTVAGEVLSPKAMENLTENVLALFKEPLYQALEKTLGSAVEGSRLIQRSTATMSALARIDLARRLNEATAEASQAKDAPQNGVMTHGQMRRILNTSTQSWLPFRADTQNLALSANDKVLDLSGEADVARSFLTGNTGIGAELPGMQEIGVSAISKLVQGRGDGLMIQNFKLLTDNGHMDAFDGINMLLQNIYVDGAKANQAITEAWLSEGIFTPLARLAADMQKTVLNTDFLDSLSLAELGVLTGKPELPGRIQRRIAESMLFDTLEILPEKAAEARARQQAMKEFNFSVDQMAGLRSPYMNEGQSSLEGLSYEEIANRLNDRISEILEEGGVKPAEREPTKKMPRIGQEIGPRGEDGLARGPLSALHKVLADGKNKTSPEVQDALDMALTALAGRGYEVVIGARENLRDDLKARGLDPSKMSKTTNGLMDPESRTIWLVENNASYETVAHELTHGAIADVLMVALTDPQVSDKAVVDAVARLEGLVQEFMGLDEADVETFMGHSALMAFRHAKAEIQEGLDAEGPTGRFKAIQEFLAYALTNPDTIRIVKNVQIKNPLLRLAQRAVAYLNRLLSAKTGKRMAVGMDFYSNIRMNAAVLMNSKVPNSVKIVQMSLLAHNAGTDAHSARVRDFGAKMAELFARAYDKVNAAGTTPSMLKSEFLLKAAHIADALTNQGFGMTEQERGVFQAAVAAMTATTVLDPQSVRRFHQIRAEVLDYLKDYTSVMVDPTSSDPDVIQDAMARFDALTGRIDFGKDQNGHSLDLPVFVALAQVHPEMRRILEQIPVRKSAFSLKDSMDKQATRVGASMMKRLNDWVLGTNGKSFAKALPALDQMTQLMAASAAETIKPTWEEYADQTSNFIDLGNQMLTDAVSDQAVKGVQWLDNMAGAAKGTEHETIASLAASAGKTMLGFIDKNADETQSEMLLALVAEKDVPIPVRDLVAELVGMTKTNARVLEMVRITKSAVQRVREHYRNTVPAILRDGFKKSLTAQQWARLYKGLGLTDLAVAGEPKTILKLIKDDAARAARIQTLEGQITKLAPGRDASIFKASTQLADFMITGQASSFQVRNAYAIAAGLTGPGATKVDYTQALVTAIDELVSLKAYDLMPDAVRNELKVLAQTEAKGLEDVAAYAKGIRATEMERMSGADLLNHFKGYVGAERRGMVRVVPSHLVADAKLEGYVQGARIHSTAADPDNQVLYVMHRKEGMTGFQQGALQNARQTSSGVDSFGHYALGGRSAGMVWGDEVETISSNLSSNNYRGGLVMTPVFDSEGAVIAYDRLIPDSILEEHAPRVEDLAASLGHWRGRQVEEILSAQVNLTTVDRLKAMWDDNGNEQTYEDLFQSKDPVIQDALKAMPANLKEHIAKTFGGRFMVRSDMVNNVIGYRSPSIGDSFTGVSRLKEETQENLRLVLTGLFGEKAFSHLTGAERVWRNLMSDARVAIVIKSGVVPLANAISNVYQLMSRGVPLHVIVKAIPRITAETHAYAESLGRIQRWETEADIAFNRGDRRRAQALQTKIKAEQDMVARLSIAPLIAKGEFSMVSEGLEADELNPKMDRFWDHVRKHADELLPRQVVTAGRYALATKDTSLFKFLARSTAYGDFVAKAVLYEHLTNRKVEPMTSEDALRDVSNEFINYDLLPGRTRSYLEQMGLLWFWNFKLRAIRRAGNHIRNNPVHLLLSSFMPAPEMSGSLFTDNALSKLFQGTLSHSIGPGMALSGAELLPGPQLVGEII